MSQIYWRMKNKKLMKISDMTMEHLENAIKMFEGSGLREEEVKTMRLELEYRKQLQAWTPRKKK